MQSLNMSYQKTQILGRSLGLLSGFFITELGVGLWIHSLSLVADAGHLLSDIATLGLTLIASWIAQRSNPNHPHPIKWLKCRTEVLAALFNSLSLMILTTWVAGEAIIRLQSPNTEILSIPMLVTAVIGLGVNGFNAFWLHSYSHQDLNFRAAFMHILADLFSSVGVILAAIAISWLGWMWVDSAICLLVSTAIAISTVPLITQSIGILSGKAALETKFICDCNRRDLEKVLFPSLEESVR